MVIEEEIVCDSSADDDEGKKRRAPISPRMALQSRSAVVESGGKDSPQVVEDATIVVVFLTGDQFSTRLGRSDL